MSLSLSFKLIKSLLTLLLGLIYQSSHILDLMEENSSLDHQISLMQRRRHQNEEAIGNLQGLLKASVNNDPRIFLKTLFQEHPGFIANESQLHKLATACGWLLADFEPLEEVQTFLARPSDIPLHTATLNDVEVRMEGLDENISGLPTEMLASFDEAEPQDPSSLVVSNDDNAPLVSLNVLLTIICPTDPYIRSQRVQVTTRWISTTPPRLNHLPPRSTRLLSLLRRQLLLQNED